MLPVKSFTNFDASSSPLAETEYQWRDGSLALACSTSIFRFSEASSCLSAGKALSKSVASACMVSSSRFFSPGAAG